MMNSILQLKPLSIGFAIFLASCINSSESDDAVSPGQYSYENWVLNLHHDGTLTECNIGRNGGNKTKKSGTWSSGGKKLTLVAENTTYFSEGGNTVSELKVIQSFSLDFISSNRFTDEGCSVLDSEHCWSQEWKKTGDPTTNCSFE